MRLSIKARQVIAVTAIVGLAVVVLGALYVSAVARVRLEASRATGELLANAIYHRARGTVAGSRDPYAALRDDFGLHSILEASAYSPNVTYAAIVDRDDRVIAHGDAHQVGAVLPARPSLERLLDSGAWTQLRTIFEGRATTLEMTKPLLMGDERFGTIRIGVSMLLTRADLERVIRPAAITAILAVLLASLVAMVAAQSLLRPVHLIRTGLSRIGRGGHGDPLGLSVRQEAGDFEALPPRGEQAPADRSAPDLSQASLETLVAGLEDALALFDREGRLLFANGPMRSRFRRGARTATIRDLWEPDDLRRQLVEATCADGQSRGPLPASDDRETHVAVRVSGRDAASALELVRTDPVGHDGGGTSGVLLVLRPMTYLRGMEAALRSARRATALGRLSAGVAHELKNPLNAMAIHLELLRQQVSRQGTEPAGEGAAAFREGAAAAEHVRVIGTALQRLDDALQGYLKFIRPEELELEALRVESLFEHLMPIVRAEATRSGIDVSTDCAPDLPPLPGDRGMLHQALLNLALNACQAMADGGRLRLTARSARSGRIELTVEDTGAGIPPEHLARVFDLYFTTRPGGSGMGLSLVYRTVQLHDGEIEVESSPGRGTTFRILLPAAPADDRSPGTGS